MNSVSDVWKSITDSLGATLTPVTMKTWFDDCRAVDLDEKTLTLYTPSSFKRNVITQRYLPAIRQALYDLFSSDFEVKLLDDESFLARQAKDAEPLDEGCEDYTFENFVVGNSNKFAAAAAVAVAQGADSYNPLLIYGNSGLGKTHLLNAIRHEIQRRHPEYHIVYVKGDSFTNEMIAAIQSGRNVEFREKYRNADLFLMDDVQFIAGRESSQEEMFHTFNSLYEAGRQIVFTADRPPAEMLRLDDRLRTRFTSGLLACVEPPDFETRAAIIRNKASQLALKLPDDVVEYVATIITANVRQIEGSVNKIKAYHDLMGGTVDVATASKILKDMFRDKTAFLPTPDLITEETAKYFNLSLKDLKGQSRTKTPTLARQISMYLIRSLTNFTLSDIGNYFDRDHTTVLSSLQKIESMEKEDPSFAQTLRDIKANINSRS